MDHLEYWRYFVLASHLLSIHHMPNTDFAIADALLLHFAVIFSASMVAGQLHPTCTCIACNLVERVKGFEFFLL